MALQDTLNKLKKTQAEDSKGDLLAKMAAEIYVREGKEEAEKVTREHGKDLKMWEMMILKDKIQKEIEKPKSEN